MNTQKLMDAQERFFDLYPQGFEDEALVPIVKRHNLPKLATFVEQSFAKEAFRQPMIISENFAKLIGRSTMISLFEKPKLRDFVGSLGSEEKDILATALFELLHGNAQEGFELLVDLLAPAKLAKWSIVSCLPAYYAPQKEVFIKPNTVKMIIEELELSIRYKPTPTWEFYTAYAKEFLALKSLVRPEVATSNAAFSGFLMISLGTWPL